MIKIKCYICLVTNAVLLVHVIHNRIRGLESTYHVLHLYKFNSFMFGVFEHCM